MISVKMRIDDINNLASQAGLDKPTDSLAFFRIKQGIY